jgi:hypothetical protein
MIFLLNLLGLTLTIAGAIHWKRARRVRVGDEPHCPKCGYLLVGIDSDRCPECGASITPATIVRGQRARTWPGGATLLAGLIFLAPGLIGLAMQINWYHLEPAFMLIRQVRSGATSGALAFNELLRRERAGSLSLTSARSLVDVALQQQSAPVPNPALHELVGFAQQQYDLGRLTDAQKQLLMKQSIRLTLRIRPRVALGDDVPYEVSKETRIVSPWEVLVSSAAASIDGKQVRGPESGYGTSSGIGGGGSFGQSIPCKTPSVHRLDALVHMEVRRHDDADNVVLYQEERILTGTFEVVVKPSSDLLTVIDDATLGPQIQACLMPRQFRWTGNRLLGEIQIRNAPVNLSFHLFARYNDHEHP